jgi:hypothetical protein
MSRASGKIEPAAQTPSAAPEGGEDNLFCMRRMKVRADREAVFAFQRATCGSVKENHVPLTFPVYWLALPDVRGMLEALLGKGFFPVHEAQSFNYLQSLVLDADYELDVELSRSQKPPRLTLNATVMTSDGAPCVRIETVLRLVPVE